MYASARLDSQCDNLLLPYPKKLLLRTIQNFEIHILQAFWSNRNGLKLQNLNLVSDKNFTFKSSEVTKYPVKIPVQNNSNHFQSIPKIRDHFKPSQSNSKAFRILQSSPYFLLPFQYRTMILCNSILLIPKSHFVCSKFFEFQYQIPIHSSQPKNPHPFRNLKFFMLRIWTCTSFFLSKIRSFERL